MNIEDINRNTNQSQFATKSMKGKRSVFLQTWIPANKCNKKTRINPLDVSRRHTAGKVPTALALSHLSIYT